MAQFEIITTVEFPNYIRQYQQSKGLRAKYFEQGKRKLPINICDKKVWKEQGVREPDLSRYSWQQFPVVRANHKSMKLFLVDNSTGERVLSNEKTLGKGKWVNINGQALLSGKIKSFEKNAMFNQIKDFFRPTLEKVAPIKRFPIVMRMEVHDVLIDDNYNRGQEWDLENRFLPYSKPLHDLLVDLKIIPEDNVKYVTGPMQPLFCPIENPSDRKMVLHIFKDNRPLINNDVEYKYFLKESIC